MLRSLVGSEMCIRDRYQRRVRGFFSNRGMSVLVDDGSPDAELEECCICLDSLSASPVVALLGTGTGTRSSCPHFLHSCCASRLSPMRCPLCRIEFGAVSAGIDAQRLAAAGPDRIVAGVRQLAGQTFSCGDEAPLERVVALLAAVCPVKQQALEAVALEHQGPPGQISAVGLTSLLPKCGIQSLGRARASGKRLERHTFCTRVSRRVRALMLQAAGAMGTTCFAGSAGGIAGLLLGALFAVPRSVALDSLDWDFPRSEFEAVLHAVLLAIQMLYYGAKRKDLLQKGLGAGALLGAVAGWFGGAFMIVHPEGHGMGSAFLSGLNGSALRAFFRGTQEYAVPEESRCDIFADLSEDAD
eukprot:TRINITY_DN49384_c0_g1_i1.p1 TRINITY_DN49384_c0_g1~~TRINITY_DN49384_c0_g1_i1.p1  ORF type:complete len:391 (-),score=64.37 TRINITY_DN49384_c0_g1_i1:257-1327(-)